MAHIEIESVRRQARPVGRIQRTHLMLYAAGLASLTIIAVAATIMTKLL